MLHPSHVHILRDQVFGQTVLQRTRMAFLRRIYGVPGELLICPEFREFCFVVECGNTRSRDPFHPSPHDRRPSRRSRRPPLRRSRVRAPQTSTPNPQSFAAAVTESTHFRSPRRRFVCSPRSHSSPDPFSHRSETFDSLAPPLGPEEP